MDVKSELSGAAVLQANAASWKVHVRMHQFAIHWQLGFQVMLVISLAYLQCL